MRGRARTAGTCLREQRHDVEPAPGRHPVAIDAEHRLHGIRNRPDRGQAPSVSGAVEIVP
jgi:hypothetical protein